MGEDINLSTAEQPVGENGQVAANNNTGEGQPTNPQTQAQINIEDTPPPVRKVINRLGYEKRQAIKQVRNEAKNELKEEEGEEQPQVPNIQQQPIIDEQTLETIKSIGEQTQSQADEMEVRDVISKHPELSQFEAKARKWWTDPSRRNLPFVSVLMEAAGPQELYRIGAEISAKAQAEANANNMGGSTNRTGNIQSKMKPIMQQTPEEFEALQAKVKSGERI